MRLLFCKINEYSLEDLEPELINYQSKKIDIEQNRLIGETVPIVLTGLTLRNYRSYTEFYVCRPCGKVYWQGTHWQRRVNRDANNNTAVDDDNEDTFYDAEETL